jgi:6-phosphogluconolactonase (cycloisomerase 2 family)
MGIRERWALPLGLCALVAGGCQASDALPRGPAFAYVANMTGNSVSVFEIDGKTGQLTPRQTIDAVDPRYLEVHPSGRFLFVTEGTDHVTAHAIDQASGTLTQVPGSAGATGSNPYNIALDPDGRFLYVANVGSNTVSGFAVNDAGLLTEIQGSPFAAGSLPYALVITDSRRFLYVANRGSNTPADPGSVSAYAIDATTGTLTPLTGSPFGAGNGPRAIELSANGRFALVVNRFSNDLSVFRLDEATGGLREIAGSPFAAGGEPRSVALTPSGRFVLVPNSASNDVSVYGIDDGSGALTPVAGAPFPAGTKPLSVAVDDSGAWVYVSNQGSSDVSVYALDGATGAALAGRDGGYPRQRLLAHHLAEPVSSR